MARRAPETPGQGQLFSSAGSSGRGRKAKKKVAGKKKAGSAKKKSKKTSGRKAAGAKKATKKASKKKAAKKSAPKATTKATKKSAPKATTKATAAPVAKTPRKKAKGRRGRTAREMALKQREISVSEFFSKNRHLLGFDSPARALLTAVKEAVDNALDACEEAGVLPDLKIEIQEKGENRFRLVVEDNGPGIVAAQIPKIFGKLLYGSKFHSLKQSRGQQGIGISAAGMYGQLTTGKPVVIHSRTGPKKPAHYFELVMDTARNKAKILVDREEEWLDKEHGTRVEIELEGTYRRGMRGVDGYVELTHMANPHTDIRYKAPKGGWIHYPRATQELPAEPREIKPHPYGVELGLLIKMLHSTGARTLQAALSQDFSRVTPRVAKEIIEKAKLRPNMRPSKVATRDAEALAAAIPQVKILAPPTSCISPVGEDVMLAGLLAGLTAQGLEPAFTTSTTRRPAIYRGNPFQVEVALAWGGNIPADELARIYRFANRVPLQYQQNACAIGKAVAGAGWRNYGLQQARGAPPTGPLVIFVEFTSVWVPFTSEAKEAVASYDEILKELRLALQECGRRLGIFIKRRRREADELRKRSHIETFIPIIGEALQEILTLSDRQRDKAVVDLTGILHRSRKDS